MIVAPDWTTLSGVSVGLDAASPIERKQALERVLHLIVDEMPDVHGVRLYDLDGDVAIVRAATDLQEKAASPLTQMPAIVASLDAGQNTWHADQRQWIGLLRVGEHVFAVLEILVEELDEEWLAWCDVLTDMTAKALALSERAPSPLLSAGAVWELDTPRFVTASRMLLSAEGHQEIATAAMYIISPRITGVMVTLFDSPVAQDTPTAESINNNGRFVGAVATRDFTQHFDRDATIGGLPQQSFLDLLCQNVPVAVGNIQTDAGYLTGWMREYLFEIGVQQVIAFGLTSNGHVVGTLDLFSTEPQTLSQVELDLYTGFANQVGTTILSKRLLQQSLESQRFASQLVNTNKAIAAAETYEDMARAVLNDAPEDIMAVAIALFNRPFTLMGSPSSLRTHAIVTRQRTITDELVDTFSALEDARVTYFLHEYLEGRMMMLWNIARPRPAVLAASLVDQLKQEEIDVITSFGLNMGGSLRGLLVFAGADDIRDPGARYDGLRALADQLAAVIENRILLQQATEALDLIRSQYETSSSVFRSGDLSEILRAVFDFANGAFSHAHLVTTDIDGVQRIVAEVTPDGHRAILKRVSLDDYPASSTLSMLEVLEVRNVAEDVFISDEERVGLQQQGIGGFVILPILSSGALSGLMMLTNAYPVRVPPDRLRAMRSLADQVSVVLENRKLLHNTEANLEEIQLLYETNQALLNAQGMADVMHVLQNTLAPDASVLCQVRVIYSDNDAASEIERLVLDYERTYNSERGLDEVLATERAKLDQVYHYLRRLDRSVIFSPKGAPVPGNPVEFVQDRYEIESYAAIIVRERGQIARLLLLIYDEPKPFTEGTRRLYEAIADQISVTIENRKLLIESQESAQRLAVQVRTLQAIGDIAMQINTLQDERELLDIGARTMKETVQVDHVGIVLYNEDRQTGVLVGEHPRTEAFETIVSTKGNPILTPDFDYLSEVVVLNNVTEENFMFEDMLANLQAVMLVPLVGLNGELIGSAGLDVTTRPHNFTEDDIRTARTIAAQLAVGLQNLRLLADSQQRAAQLQRITDFSQTAQSSLNMLDIIEAALTSVPHLITVQHMSVALYDDIREALVMTGGWQKVNNLRRRMEGEVVVSRAGTVIGYVYETGAYLYMPDATVDTRLRYKYAEGMVTLLAIPLKNRGRVLGVVTVGSTQHDAYTDTDIALFQQLVNQMSVAIDNARTYTQSQRVAQNKTLANEISVQLQRQNDITRMIDLTMKEVGRAIGAKRGRIRLNANRPEDDENGA